MNRAPSPYPEIQNALQALQQRPDDGASLLILDPASKRGIVFASHLPGQLQFSFASSNSGASDPATPGTGSGSELLLSRIETRRLKKLLKHENIAPNSTKIPHPEDPANSVLTLIEGPLADPAQGAVFVDLIFTEVFQTAPPVEFTILSD
jgi:hypothetical protein